MDENQELNQENRGTVVRGIALTPTQGLTRSSIVIDTGKPLMVPVGEQLPGRVFNVFGSTIDHKEKIKAKEWRSIHQPPLPLYQQTTNSEIFETGIKAIDVLAPLERGGKAGALNRQHLPLCSGQS